MPVRATTKMGGPGAGWAIAGGALRIVVTVMLAVCVLSEIAGVIRAVWLGPDRHLDFFGLWSFARFLHEGAAGAVYVPAKMQAAEQRFAAGFSGFYPCPYPPSFLACTLWLGMLPIGIAKALWSLAGAACLLAATWLMFRKSACGLAMLAVLASPAAALCLTTGETGLFTSAFLLAGLALLPEQPTLAGIAFGLLTLKPQFLVLVPVLLVAVGGWRAALAAAIAGSALILLSCLLLPPILWPDWLHSLADYQGLVLQNQARLAHLMTTIDAGLLCLHAAPALAWGGQALSIAVLAAVTWRALRGQNFRGATAMILAATPLAAPHAFIYDTPALTAAILLAVEGWTSLSTPMLLLCAAIFLLPLAMAGYFAPCIIYAVPETLLVYALARHA